MASLIEYRQQLAERDLQQVWPQWKIVRLLGTGAFGEVYEIHREEYGRVSKSALKIIRKENPLPAAGNYYNNISIGNDTEEFISTVLREIDIMEQLKGAPNIVVIDDYSVVRNEDSSAVLIRMELLMNLGEYMTTRAGTMHDILKIGTDICNALEYCEGRNIIHRDVKESNIFYSEMGDFKLGDFGISKQLEDYLVNSGTMTSAGTVSRMAPEVYNSKKYDNRVDIYSLGMVLYSLLNYGRPPFYPPYPEAVTAEAAMQADMIRLKGTAIPPLAGVDGKLNKIIGKALSPKPAGRYKTAADFRNALLGYYEEIYGQGSAGQMRKTNLIQGAGSNGATVVSQPEARPRQKRTAVYALAAAAALLIIVGAASFGISRARKPKGYRVPEVQEVDNVDISLQAELDLGGEIEEADSTENTDQETPPDTNKETDEPEQTEVQEEETADSVTNVEKSISEGESREETGQESSETAEDGSVKLKDGDGTAVASVTAPSWGEISYNSNESASVDGKSGEVYLTFYLHYLDDSSDGGAHYLSSDQQYYDEKTNEDLNIDTVTNIETTSVGNMSVSFFFVKYQYKDSFYNTRYEAVVPCSDGFVLVEAERYADSEYPEYEESEFLSDLEETLRLED